MTTQTTDDVQTRAPGPLKALIGVLFRPGPTFTALRGGKRRYWIVPALFTLLALAFFGYTTTRITSDVMYRQQIEMMESMSQPQDPRMGEVRVEMPAPSGPHPITLGLTIGGQILGAVVTWLIWAGLLALASTFFGANGAKFGGLFAMVVWARLPFAIRSVIQAIYMTATGTLIYNQGLSGLVLDNAASAGLNGPRAVAAVSAVMGGARVLPPTRGQQIAAALLGRVDIFLVWSLILTVAGVWAFTRLPRRKALLVTLAIWVLATLVSLIPTIIGLGQTLSVF